MKQKQCQHIKSDSTKCTSFAMSDSDYCYRHNPEISNEEKINASAKGGSHSPSLSQTERGIGGEDIISLPSMKIENFNDLAAAMADSINRVRSGEISQKTGSTLAYMSFVMYMILDKAKAESKQEKIDKLKAEGKWRPEPKYAPKFYTYKDDFFLDKDGNHLVVEKDGSTFRPRLEFEMEDDNPVKRNAISLKNKRHKKHISHMNQDEIRQSPLIPPPSKDNSICGMSHLLRGNNIEQNFPPLLKGGIKGGSNDTNDEFVKQTVEILNELKEGIEMRKKEDESSP